MGRITDNINKFLLRVANRLGIKRDNLLESAKEDIKTMGPVAARPENYEEKMSDRDKFAKEMQEHATRFDPSMMSKEEAIMKILEQQGLNPEFAKNPAAVKQISEICNKNLERKGIENITSSNLDEVKFSMMFGITISKDGNLTYTDKNAKPIMQGSQYHAKREESTTFSINSDKMFEKTQRSIENYSAQKPGSFEDHYRRDVWRKKITYNENGMEMRQEYDSNLYELEGHSYNGNPLFRRGSSYTLERNPDLITARYTVQKEPNLVNYIEQYGLVSVTDTKHFKTNESASTNVYVDGEYGADTLEGIWPEYGDILSANRNRENRVKGAEIYVHYSKYDEPEKYEEQQKEHKQRIKKCAEKSSIFRKTAEEKGLIEKEAELEEE